MKLLSDEPAVQQARAHSGRIVRALNDLAALVQEAWDRRYDKVLKYKSWNAYCEGEFGSGETAVRARQIVTVMLRGEDLTEQAIADQLGVSQPTVNRDLSDQDDYEPARGGVTGDQRRARRREQYAEGSVERLARLMERPPRERVPAPGWAACDPSGWTYSAGGWTYSAGPVDDEQPAAGQDQPAIGGQPGTLSRADFRASHELPAASTAQPATQVQPAASEDQPAIGGQPEPSSYLGPEPDDPDWNSPEDAVYDSPAATAAQPAIAQQPAAREGQPASVPQPAAIPVQPATARERFLQGDTGGARAEIRRRVLAGQPVRREDIARQFGVSEMFARQATAVEEEAAGIPDTIAHCVRELTALRDKYARVLAANAWAGECLQLVIDSLRTD